VHLGNAKLIMGVNPIAAALLKSPAECGADIAVGEGQPLGLHMNFGGPYLGFMSCTQREVRRLPGRIVGETEDKNGNTAYVLTLQAREQHIRREKAASNICSNQAHCALTAAIYMTVMGREGLKEVASACLSLAHYAAEEWSKIKGVSLKYKGEFFHEFVTVTPNKSYEICLALEEKGVLAGLPLNESDILWCMTELVKKEDIDLVGEIIRGRYETYF
ncbi:MAG: aminomethyl-transferring glycine dehydrogenase, partial [Clostridia bacterium]